MPLHLKASNLSWIFGNIIALQIHSRRLSAKVSLFDESIAPSSDQPCKVQALHETILDEALFGIVGNGCMLHNRVCRPI